MSKIIAWKGHCEVHEKFSGEDVRQIRDAHPGAIVLAHPECPPDVLEEADFAGSTSALSSHVKESSARKVVLLTECSMSDNVAADNPGVEFVKPCNLCPHMKRISLENIYDALVEHEARGDGAGGHPHPRQGGDRRDAGAEEAGRVPEVQGRQRTWFAPVEII